MSITLNASDIPEDAVAELARMVVNGWEVHALPFYPPDSRPLTDKALEGTPRHIVLFPPACKGMVEGLIQAAATNEELQSLGAQFLAFPSNAPGLAEELIVVRNRRESDALMQRVAAQLPEGHLHTPE